jgi:hypothetical protein
MIDDNFQVYIIECNTNPSLELCSPLMARIIPAMLDNVFRLIVDPLFPPPDLSSIKKQNMPDLLPSNKLELVFDERLSGEHLRRIFKDQPEFNLKIQENEGEDEEDVEDDMSDSPDDEELVCEGRGGSAMSNI